MTAPEREAIVAELAEAFGEAVDVTPADGQPLHVLLPVLPMPVSWSPAPARALLRFSGWPQVRPDFFVEPALHDGSGNAPTNPSDQYILGQTWRTFSFQFPWPAGDGSASQAVMQWLNRFWT